MYILKSDSDKYYIGSTNDIDRRITQHNSGQTRTTRILKTTELVYTEEYSTISDAQK